MEKFLKPGITPFKHQREAFKIWGTKESFALLLEQGTGKTLVFIAKLGQLFQQGLITRALIICPVSVVPELEIQFESLAGYPVNVIPLSGMKRDKKRKLLSGPPTPQALTVVITNYESVWCKGTTKRKKWETLPELVKFKPQIVLCDESQRIKNATSKQSKAICFLGKNSLFRAISTGTVIAESPLDFFGQYKFLDPTIFGTAYRSFENEYAIKGGYRGYQVLDYKNLDTLTQKALKIAYRVRKKDCLDLPPVTEQVIPVELEPKARSIYNELDKEMIVEIEKTQIITPRVITKQIKLSQITGGYLTNIDEAGEKKIFPISNVKLKTTIDILSDLLYNKSKVIIFARFIPEIDGIINELKKKKIKYSEISGRIKDRKTVIREFQSPESKTPVMVVQIATGGVGITLTAADVAIFYSTDYSNTNYEQAKARIDRIGQKSKKVTIIHIAARKTIDEVISKALISKQKVSEALLDNYFKGKQIKGGSKKMKRYTQEDFEVISDNRKLVLDFNNVESRPDVIDEELGEKQLEKLLETMRQELTTGKSSKHLFDELSGESVKSNKRERVPKTNVKDKTPKTPKAPRAPRVSGEGIITLAMIAEDMQVEPRQLRKKLRDKFSPASGRWEWDSKDPQLAEVKQYLGV